MGKIQNDLLLTSCSIYSHILVGSKNSENSGCGVN
jgi:hypothetical protein